MNQASAQPVDKKLADLTPELQRAAITAAATLAAGAVSVMESSAVGGQIKGYFDTALNAILSRLNEK